MSNIENNQSATMNSDQEDFYMVQSTLIIGLGMIGGSLAKAIKENGFSRKVVGFDRSQSALELGVQLG
ncbi:MAG: prephenate dehydrogenase, partial [Oceanospirillaceae bacterium]